MDVRGRVVDSQRRRGEAYGSGVGLRMSLPRGTNVLRASRSTWYPRGSRRRGGTPIRFSRNCARSDPPVGTIGALRCWVQRTPPDVRRPSLVLRCLRFGRDTRRSSTRQLRTSTVEILRIQTFALNCRIGNADLEIHRKLPCLRW